MSSHNHHKWQAYEHFSVVRVRCEDCGVDIPWQELQETQIEHLETYQQQLAEAQAKIARQEEELRIVLAQRQDYKAHLAEARALLERMTKDKYAGFWTSEVDDYGLSAMRLCVYCSADDEEGHASNCPIVKARAFLQKNGG